MRYFIDAYRSGKFITLWHKENGLNVRTTELYRSSIYVELSGESILKKLGINFTRVSKRTHLGKVINVLCVRVPSGMFERVVKRIEPSSKHAIKLYNADIAPEQYFMYEKRLRPFVGEEAITLHRCRVSLTCTKEEITSLMLNEKAFIGDEREVLESFVSAFLEEDPDVILMKRAFSHIPFIASRMEHHKISCPFHRWDKRPIRYRGGKSFHSYGQVRFKDFAVRLNGRFLVDSGSTVGEVCDVEGIMELSELTGARFQQVASRSFGSIFQQSLLREMVEDDVLIPHKEKPVDMPMSLMDMVKGDRAGHTFDPKKGFHQDVAEIDFSSMFPWLIYNHNISSEMLASKKEPLEQVPGLPITISHAKKGYVPRAIKSLLDKRMYYKDHPTCINRKRAAGIKWVLVTSYGYLRFREFKLGVATSHMAICAYARQTIIDAAKMAEERGFQVIHGIVDCLYIKKKGIQEDEVRLLCDEIKKRFSIPTCFEGIFKWITFLPSVVDAHRPLPSSYFGAYATGRYKARGIELRRRSTPIVVKEFQEHTLDVFSNCNSRKAIRGGSVKYKYPLRVTIVLYE